MANEMIPYTLTMPAAVLEKNISTRLAEIEDPAEMADLASFLKLMKKHPAIQSVSGDHRHEIWWGEILAYWKAADLLDGKIKEGRPKTVTNDDSFNWQSLGIDRRDGHKWMRLHDGFPWEALLALKEQIKLPGLNTILRLIPSETILITPAPGKYPIIYADPPWKYEFAQFGDVGIKYDTLTLEQIIDYEIEGKLLKQDYFDKNAVLFLWATCPKLEEALRVMNAWGFDYKTNICWDKVAATSSTMGMWLQGRHELLLIGTKGKLSPPSPDRKIESIYQEKKTKHSKKPEFFYELIEGWYRLPADAKYLELFARGKHSERWEVLGNQVS